MAVAWQQVFTRQRGACWLCDEPMQHAHHRQTRRFGPDCPANLLGLCAAHHASVHAAGVDSRAAGWIVSRHTDEPCQVTVVDRFGVEWRLLCDGGRVEVDR